MRTDQDDPGAREPVSLDPLIDQITAGAAGDNEVCRVFERALKAGVRTPCDGHVVGEPVVVLRFDYDGNPRRGLTARCRREDGSEHVVSAADVSLSPPCPGSEYLAAYRKWLGVEPFPMWLRPPAAARAGTRSRTRTWTSAA